MSNDLIQVEELQSVEDRDLETLGGLGAVIEINGLIIPPPTTAVLSLLEIIDSPFIRGFSDLGEITLTHLNEAIYILCQKEKAVSKLFGIKRIEKIAEKTPEHFEKYIKSLAFSEFEKDVFSFIEKLGVFNYLETISKIQDYINACFSAFDLLPQSEKNSVKKKDISIMNF